MRILHTADWHLGKLFYGNYLTEDQAYVLEQQLLPMIRDEGIDAVVLAGDVYDRPLPAASWRRRASIWPVNWSALRARSSWKMTPDRSPS